MQSSQSFGCTSRTTLFEPYGHFPGWIPSGGWAEKFDGSPAMKSCGYARIASSFHTVHILPLSKILSNPWLLEAVKAKPSPDGKRRFYHNSHRFSRLTVKIEGSEYD
jgi:hypothetical protein